MDKLVCVTITGPDGPWLASHTRELVHRRLAACGNITTQVRSIYRWQDQIEDEHEAKVTLHTRAHKLPELIQFTNDNHPYDIVQIVATDVVGVDPNYEQWVIEQTD